MRPTILAFLDYFTPGYKAGGPIRYMENLISRLNDEFRFRIVTRDRDFCEHSPYPDLATETWIDTGQAQVMYLSPRSLGLGGVRQVLNDTAYDVLNINSVFSKPFSIQTLALRRMNQVPSRPLILAPRGELAASALAKSPLRKRAYLSAARSWKLCEGLTWQASSAHERDDILKQFPAARIVLTPEPMARSGAAPSHKAKAPGELKAIFLSRIHRVKNLDYALRVLSRVKNRVTLEIYGPQEDPSYFRECSKLMQALPPNTTATYCGVLHSAQVADTLRNNDLLILPTKGENFGHVIVESLLAGTPVLISDQTPWRDLEQHSAGWALPLDDVDGFARAVDTVAEMNAEQHHRLAIGSWRYAQEKGDDPAIVSANRMLFQNALESQDD